MRQNLKSRTSAAMALEAEPAFEGASDVLPVEALAAYLQQCTFALLSHAIKGNEELFEECVCNDDVQARIASFSCDPHQHILIVVVKEDAFDIVLSLASEGDCLLSGSSHVHYQHRLAFVRQSEALSADVPLEQQVRVCQLNAASPFEDLLALVRFCFYPYSRAMMSNMQQLVRDKDRSADLFRSIDGKLGELEVDLLRSHMNVEVPQVALDVNPEIQRFVDECEKAHKKPMVSDLSARLSDDVFLNKLQKDISVWKSKIRSLTSLDRDVSAGSVLQEISFWLGVERAVNGVIQQLQSRSIEFIFEVLRHQRRFHAVTGFQQDSGITEIEPKVKTYCELLRDFPIRDMLSASSIEAVVRSIQRIFAHLRQLKRIDYPLPRSLKLVHALSRDLATKLIALLDGKRLVLLDYPTFEKATSGCFKVFKVWRSEYQQFRDDLRELRRYRSADILAVQPLKELVDLEVRINDFRDMRRQHKELRRVLMTSFSQESAIRDSAIADIDVAYENFRACNVLDISSTGMAHWKATLAAYDQHVENVESGIEARIRELLTDAQDDADEMFRVCARFNALFVRPRIQNSIREHQETLIATVRRGIQELQDKFKAQYGRTEASVISRVRDLPKVSGAIVWAKQIERQLNAYMQKVEDVLGMNWCHHIEGQSLKSESDLFRERLQPDRIFHEWLKRSSELPQFDVDAPVFCMEDTKRYGLQLQVNFHHSTVELFKEVRHLSSLGLRVPYELRVSATEAKLRYPFAVRLAQSLELYKHSTTALHDAKLGFLVASAQNALQQGLRDGVSFRWHLSDRKMKQYVDSIVEAATRLDEQTTVVLKQQSEVSELLDELETCEATPLAVTMIVQKLQGLVDALEVQGYTNVHVWISSLDERVQTILLQRLEEMLSDWLALFDDATTAVKDDDDVGGAFSDEGAQQQPQHKRRFLLEMELHNQTLHVSPSLPALKMQLLDDLYGVMDLVCAVPRLSRYWPSEASQLSPDRGGGDSIRSGGGDSLSRRLNTRHGGVKELAPSLTGIATYDCVLKRCDSTLLKDCYRAIRSVMDTIGAFVGSWLRLQSLWDLELSVLFNELSSDLGAWTRMLIDISSTRSSLLGSTVLASSSSTTRFGPVTVSFGRVRDRVEDKYERLHRSFMACFAEKLAEQLKSMNELVTQARRNLEDVSMQTVGSLSDSVVVITLLRDSKHNFATWKTRLDVLLEGERLLSKNRFVFGDKWLNGQQVESNLMSLGQILERRSTAFHDVLPQWRSRLADESRLIESAVAVLDDEWRSKKPNQGDVGADIACELLSYFDASLTRIEQQQLRVQEVHSSIRSIIAHPPSSATVLAPPSRLAVLRSEIDGLRDVWTALQPEWEAFNALEERLMVDTRPGFLRTNLDAQLERLHEMPSRVQQYDAHAFLVARLVSCLEHNLVVLDLQSPVLKPKHHRQLSDLLFNATKMWSEIRLGQVWACDLAGRKQQIQQIVEQAQGENALYEFFGEMESSWQESRLVMSTTTSVPLIRNFAAVVDLIADLLSNLNGMCKSPFYAAVDGACTAFQKELSSAQLLFECWMDVQKRWLYLSGVLNANQDAQQQLASQFHKFRSVDVEFAKLQHAVAANPLVRVWASSGMSLIEDGTDVRASLEHMLRALGTIQAALGDYLNRQRAAFPRFFFVGDEDLLEVLGRPLSPENLQRHLPKLFAGIHLLAVERTDDSCCRIVAMCSSEGERVALRAPVDVRNGMKIHEWLCALEAQMRSTLAALVVSAVAAFPGYDDDVERWLGWLHASPVQVVLLALQVVWTRDTERSIGSAPSLSLMLSNVDHALVVLADVVSRALDNVSRVKIEQVIAELVHERQLLRRLVTAQPATCEAWAWKSCLRLYLRRRRHDDVNDVDVSETLEVCMGARSFAFGYEYQGVCERLVQTDLSDRTFLTLLDALGSKMGGCPFGPAGTGKTETVKALAAQLGRQVLVFNCDESFNASAMCRILIGLCQSGAFGCFDEFNRLEERMLSAVSKLLETIQVGLKHGQRTVSLGKTASVRLDPNAGIFVTMNPGYAGRAPLPDNLKLLCRSVAMVRPDSTLIAEVTLFSQGFRQAESLARKVVALFNMCRQQLSLQSHYDFGLRALKTVLRSAGGLLRDAAAGEDEELLFVKSLSRIVVPKLVSADVPLFANLVAAVLPLHSVTPVDSAQLEAVLPLVCEPLLLRPADAWKAKVMQLYGLQNLHHGIILVGPEGSGKSTCWRALLAALERIDGVPSRSYVVDPKAMRKSDIYGSLDATTLEWTDGVFTSILRRILADERGERSRRYWIVFDGDVDPDWAENLNSVLDDNRILTLPNGERLALPDNVRILLEVHSLRFATPATVSRCGMVWFSPSVLDHATLSYALLDRIRHEPLHQFQRSFFRKGGAQADVQTLAADILAPYVMVDTASATPSLVECCLDWLCDNAALDVMHACRIRALDSLLSLLQASISAFASAQRSLNGVALRSALSCFLKRRLLTSLFWAVTSGMETSQRSSFCEFLYAASPSSLIDSWPSVESVVDPRRLPDSFACERSGRWRAWDDAVEHVDLEPHAIVDSDLVVDTIETVRLRALVMQWIGAGHPLLLCGPPGCGKSMTLVSALSDVPDLNLVTLSFSSTSSPELLLSTLRSHCELERSTDASGAVQHTMHPIGGAANRLVIFCDEINLPKPDDFDTQPVLAFIRQISEHGGYWDVASCSWISLQNVLVVGACNPPSDAGRWPISRRLLRHCRVLLVDFPGASSLHRIYGAFNAALLKLCPQHRMEAPLLTSAMLDVYDFALRRFAPLQEEHPHYIFSPRELSRWVRALLEALRPHHMSTYETSGVDLVRLSLADLVRLWLHEGLRLFQDRLVDADSQNEVGEFFNATARKHFSLAPEAMERALARPVLYSSWLSSVYEGVERDELRAYVKARLAVFYEEVADVKLVLFDDVLEHLIRIDRVLRQPLGHLLLVGASGSGKTVLSRFVAWMNGLEVFSLKVHQAYSSVDFDCDLRKVLMRSGCDGQRIAFIFDESNVLESGFLERMNALLATGEVPGLFEDAERMQMLSACRDRLKKCSETSAGDSDAVVYQWFRRRVQKNLHVVFTMNPRNTDFTNRAATSPALFNRCVVDWFGDWSTAALHQIGHEFTARAIELDVDVDVTRSDLVAALVAVHGVAQTQCEQHRRRTGLCTYVTPRHFLDLIANAVELLKEKRAESRARRRHVTCGLQRLGDTEQQVTVLQKALDSKTLLLQEKSRLANEKLEQMMHDQRLAEQKRDESLRIASDLQEQRSEIEQRRQRVECDLANVEPALLEAKAAVQNIKKEQLDELRGFNNPPTLVKLALEPVMMLLGYSSKLSWADVRRALRKNDFIPNILQFDSDTVGKSTRAHIEKNYLANADYSFELINRASSACGPLVLWVRSQLEFSLILSSVAPLRAEVHALTDETDTLQRSYDELQLMIAEIERSIATYKDEYKTLICESEHLKADMQAVQQKVSRSQRLLASLSSERSRWESSLDAFADGTSTLLGDTIACCAFATYGGYFDAIGRRQLIDSIRAALAALPLSPTLSFVEHLSTAAQRLSWRDLGVQDAIGTENAVILQCCRRYPLVIDPSGEGAAFLAALYEQNASVVRTSLLDVAFVKTLEAALRLGNTLLVDDVERVDAILNPVLNHEVQRVGGRILIRLADKLVDVSPTFHLILLTRQSSAHFTPDICSRVTFVNFTITPTSLKAQCLHAALLSERPSLEKRRTALERSRHHCDVRLHELEEELLHALSGAGANVLENQELLDSLETLQREAADTASELSNTIRLSEDAERASATFEPFADACVAAFFAMESLQGLHPLYNFDLRWFRDVVISVLTSESRPSSSTDDENASERVQQLVQALLVRVYGEGSCSLLDEDRAGFALSLACIKRSIDAPDCQRQALLAEFATRPSTPLSALQLQALPACVQEFVHARPQLSSRIAFLLSHPSFTVAASGLRSGADIWCCALTIDDVSASASSLPVPSVGDLEDIILTASLWPSAMSTRVGAFVASTLGGTLRVLDLQHLVKSSSCPSLILLLSSAGYDGAWLVQELAVKENKMTSNFASIALGSSLVNTDVDAALKHAARSGSWLLLQNIHVLPTLMGELENRVHVLRRSARPGFKVFATASLDSSNPIPPALVHGAFVIMLERPIGLKASLERSWSMVGVARAQRPPQERARLHLLVALLHALLVERVRYAPIGFRKAYEFSHVDLECALAAVDTVFDAAAASGADHIAPEHISWDTIGALLRDVIYGGRVDDVDDEARLAMILEDLFNETAFSASFCIGHTTDAASSICLPSSARSHDDFSRWIASLEASYSPEVLGLPSQADTLLGIKHSERIVEQMRLYFAQRSTLAVSRSDIAFSPSSLSSSRTVSSLPAPKLPAASDASTPLQVAERILAALPTSPLSCEGNVDEPLQHAIHREQVLGNTVLALVRSDLNLVVQYLNTENRPRPTNRVRDLMLALHSDKIPDDWKLFSSSHRGLAMWVDDLSQRLQQLAHFSSNWPDFEVWLGGLFFPVAFLAAAKESVAHQYEWPIEKMKMSCAIGSPHADGIRIRSCILSCAEWNEDEAQLSTSSSLFSRLQKLCLFWRLTSDEEVASDQTTLPVYADTSRKLRLFTVNLPCCPQRSRLLQSCGACLLLSNL